MLSSAGRVVVSLVVAPTLDFVPGRGLRAAVSFDDEPPQEIDFLADRSQPGGAHQAAAATASTTAPGCSITTMCPALGTCTSVEPAMARSKAAP